MKNLLEYLQSGHLEKEDKNIAGDHILYDNVPCTVVLNDGLHLYLMSDIFVGTNAGKPTFKANDEVNHTNFAFYTWTDIPDIPKAIADAGWAIPAVKVWFKSEAAKNVLKYITDKAKFNASYDIWCKDGRKKIVWNLKTDNLENYDEAGVRFVKIVKL